MRKVFVVNRLALVPSPSLPSLREGGRLAHPPRVAYLNSKVLSQTRFTACDGPENCVYHCLLLLSWPKRRANATADCARK